METNNLTIRPLHPDDIDDLYEMITDPRVVNTLVFVPSMELGDEEAWLKNKGAGSHRLVAELNGKVICSGTIRQSLRARMTHSGHLGLLVHADYWGKGIGTAMMTALLELADNWLNLMRVQLEVFTDNPAAIHIYKQNGFEIEGTRRQAIFGGDGRFHDEHVMARIREWGVSPSKTVEPEPKPQAPGLQISTPITIRPMHPDDAAGMHNLWRHPQVARTTLQMPSLEYSEAAQKVEKRPAHGHRFVAVANGRILGTCSIFVDQNPRSAHCAGLGMMVHPESWGQGIGSKLIKATLDLADNWLNIKRVDLEVNVDNPAAVHLYKKYGFEIEGTKRWHTYGDGRWADSYFMARFRE